MSSEPSMDADLQKELRELERRLTAAITSVRTDGADAVATLAAQVAGIDARIAAMSANEKDILRLERELAEVKAKNVQQDDTLNTLKTWKAAQEARASVTEKGADFWRGLGGRVLGAILITVILGAGGTLLGVYIMLQQAGG